VCVYVFERESVCVRERESVHVRESVCVYVCACVCVFGSVLCVFPNKDLNSMG